MMHAVRLAYKINDLGMNFSDSSEEPGNLFLQQYPSVSDWLYTSHPRAMKLYSDDFFVLARMIKEAGSEPVDLETIKEKLDQHQAVSFNLYSGRFDASAAPANFGKEVEMLQERVNYEELSTGQKVLTHKSIWEKLAR